MAVSSIKEVINSNVKKVWDMVLDYENYTWRSDLSKTEVIDENQFVEYTKDGYHTTFTVTLTEPFKRWEFDMENTNMKGHWTGVFTEKGDSTEIEFTEYVEAKKFYLKPFIKLYLKKQQKQFVSDLKMHCYKVHSSILKLMLQ